ncbi:MAG: flagellar basal body-associated FliL family protein [Acidobacteria bacterium]|nr:flagellar basal body-associated FliL family protein [Acidobacteriota bacterium]
MAWEEENIDTGVNLEEIGGRRSPIKLIIMGVIALAVLGGIGYAVWLFFLKPKPAEDSEKLIGEPTEQVETQTPQPTGSDTVGYKVSLERFIMNLADRDEPRYLQTTMVLEVDNQELQANLTAEADPKLYMVKTRDIINDVLRTKVAQQFNDPDTIKEIRKELVFRLNSV